MPPGASKEMKWRGSSFRLGRGLLKYYKEAGRLLISHVLVLVLEIAKVSLCCSKQWQLFVNQYLISKKPSLPYAENSMNPVFKELSYLIPAFYLAVELLISKPFYHGMQNILFLDNILPK